MQAEVFPQAIAALSDLSQAAPPYKDNQNTVLKEFLTNCATQGEGFYAQLAEADSTKFCAAIEQLSAYTKLPSDIQTLVWRVRTLLVTNVRPNDKFMGFSFVTVADKAIEPTIRAAVWKFLQAAFLHAECDVLPYLDRVEANIRNASAEAKKAAKKDDPAHADPIGGAITAAGILAQSVARASSFEQAKDGLHKLYNTLTAHLLEAREKKDLARVETLSAILCFQSSLSEHFFTPEKAGGLADAVMTIGNGKGDELRKAYWSMFGDMIKKFTPTPQYAQGQATKKVAPKKPVSPASAQVDPMVMKWADYIKKIAVFIEQISGDETDLALPVLSEVVRIWPVSARLAFADLLGEKTKAPHERITDKRAATLGRMISADAKLIDTEFVADLTHLAIGGRHPNAVSALEIALGKCPELASTSLGVVNATANALQVAPVIKANIPAAVHYGMQSVYAAVAESVTAPAIYTDEVVGYIMAGLSIESPEVQQMALSALKAIGGQVGLQKILPSLNLNNVPKADQKTKISLLDLQGVLVGKNQGSVDIHTQWVQAATEVMTGRDVQLAVAAVELIGVVAQSGKENAAKKAAEILENTLIRTDLTAAVRAAAVNADSRLPQARRPEVTGLAALVRAGANGVVVANPG